MRHPKLQRDRQNCNFFGKGSEKKKKKKERRRRNVVLWELPAYAGKLQQLVWL
jgi:hypothetical protein